MEKPPSEERIKQVIERYVRMWAKYFRIRQGDCPPRSIECPQCGSPSGVQHQYGEWRCIWPECGFTFPLGFIPPEPDELEKMWNEIANARRSREISNDMVAILQKEAEKL